MTKQIQKGDLVKVREDLDFLTLYVSAGNSASLGLTEKSQLEHAGKVARVFAVSSDGGKVILCDPCDAKLLPGFWTPSMLEEVDKTLQQRYELLNELREINARYSAEEKKQEKKQEAEPQKESFSKVATRLASERAAYGCIADISKYTRKAYEAVKAGKDAKSHFRKVRQLAQEGEMGFEKRDETERRFRMTLERNFKEAKKNIINAVYCALYAGSLYIAPAVSAFFFCAMLLRDDIIPSWAWLVALLPILPAYVASVWLKSYIETHF